MTADNVIGKDIYALATVYGYNIPNTTGTVLYTFNAKDDIGNVFSWLQNSAGVWWQLADSHNNNFYVLHETGKLSLSNPTSANASKPLSVNNNTGLWVIGSLILIGTISYIVWKRVHK